MFVFGLPRSGTTLVEQILASHSQVFGAGELKFTRQSFDAIPSVLEMSGLGARQHRSPDAAGDHATGRAASASTRRPGEGPTRRADRRQDAR